MGLFDLDAEDSVVNDNNGKMSIRKNSYKKKARVENREEYLKERILLPSKEECVLIKSNGLSDTGAIFKHILNIEKCETLYLATWVINRENLKAIINALNNGKLKKLVFVVSTRLRQLKKSEYAFMVEEFAELKNKVFYKVCNSHAKTFSIKTKENYYTIIGSGNWTENPRIENYIIHNDKGIFDFNVEWMQELTNG